MLYRSRLVVLLLMFVVLIFGAVQVGAQGTLTLEGLSSRLDRTDARVSAIETSLAPTPTRTPRPNVAATRDARARATVQARITGNAVANATARANPTATISPAFQSALDESAANQWANAALDKARREKGLDWRKGGWMEWYNRPNLVKVFMKIVDRCDLTGEELVAQIEGYERDRTVVAMNNQYEPNITTELAIFRDYNRAAGASSRPCLKLIEIFKDQYKK